MGNYSSSVTGKSRDIHERISEMLSGTYKETVLGPGHYAGAMRFGNQYLALHTDNVGTKTVLALETGRVSNTGIDCVAMNVNDIICIGARPMALVDYIALEKPMDETVEQIMSGLIEGSKEAGVEIVGGETAIAPDVVRGYDLSASVAGVADRLKTGSEVEVGDCIIGLESSGVHSNGYSLVRELIGKGKLSLKDYEEELLAPTRIYVKPVLSVLDDIHAAAHITGGTFSKLNRITKHGIDISLGKPAEVFGAIENAGVTHDEMHRVFNMGVGMVLFVPQENKEKVIGSISRTVNAYELGKVVEEKGIRVKTYRGETLIM